MRLFRDYKHPVLAIFDSGNARRARSLHVYLGGAWLFIAWILGSGLPRITSPSTLDTVYSVLLIFSYSFFYLLPTIFCSWLFRNWARGQTIAVLSVSAVSISFLFFDNRLFGLYGFHFNSFVWNLITTRGGIASLGADQISTITISIYVLALICTLGLCLWANHKLPQYRVQWKWLLSVVLLVTMGERIIYSMAYAGLYGPILTQADHMILYQPLKMNSFLRDIGYNVTLQDKTELSDSSTQGNIVYPLEKISISDVEKPYNIIFLIAESLRYQDIYNARVMPETLQFAEHNGIQFTQHISGGNGTRQGLFAMFYGLYGNYWESFLRDRHPPVLFEVMDHYNYQNFLFTSSYFTYPEFDKTIFGSIPKTSMVETSDGEAWTRDERNIEKLLGKIDLRDKTRPFFGFVFFEATHARYSFPDTNTIEKNYLASLDYADLKAEELLPKINGMRSRYLNAAHYVDSQFGRVYDYLQANNLLENTIVIVTGDHGEEFMEHGRWGHNSSFVEQQIRVPMMIHHPDYQSGTVSRVTSHMDIPGMLMKSLGVDNPYSDFSLGGNVLENENNDTAVVASWTDLGIVSPRGKLVIPFRSSTQHTHLATTREDVPVDLGQLSSELSQEIASTIANSRKFLKQ
ncbi:MAG: sulfatase-like hydrolase/transferase, partial [Pseudohongiellaceae bacterium]